MAPAARHVVRARPARGKRRVVPVITDPEILLSVREDAAHYPGGQAGGLVHVESEADVAAALALGGPVLAIGAQSSLTGGATPRGELVLATDRLVGCTVRGDEAEAGAGLRLDAFQQALAAHDRLFPPTPTYTGATLGGVAATNAAGPATFKYGTTRQWVTGLTVVLASGDVLDLRRGETIAHADGHFDLVTSGGHVRIPIAPVQRPDVPKCSAGYALARGMDLVDLFIGAEGTLGVVTSVTVRVLRHPPATCLALVTLSDEAEAFDLAATLRAHASRTWQERDPRGLDISAIEHADRRAVTLIREDGVDRERGVTLPPDTVAALWVTVDLPPGTSSDEAWRMIEAAPDSGVSDNSLGRFCQLLASRGLLDRTEIALPGDATRRAQLLAVRESVPEAVNRRVAIAQQRLSPDISKLAGDFVVPFGAFQAMERSCRTACEARELDLVVWGHISDGNIHPNVIPRTADDLRRGREALLEAGQTVIALGGSPLAEHGVGRNPLKRRFLELLHGTEGLAAMRAVKRALDPQGLLAPGVML